MNKIFYLILSIVCVGNWLSAQDVGAQMRSDSSNEKRQTLRLVQDDAQDFMVSKVYILKYAQANDVWPFINGIIKRYNSNSTASCIEYSGTNEQVLTVSCPIKMMPYVDDFISKVDRPIKINGRVPGEIIKGSGITRAVYRPKYRSGQTLINIIVNAYIYGGPYMSVYGFDQNSNQIYWKDNINNSEYMFQFLEWLDRPPPMVNFEFVVYEVRESNLRDLGVDYLAWKNGPGLNILSTGASFFSVNSGGSDALNNASGHYGFFFFAPQFDASFIRVLQQNGYADIKNTSRLTVANSSTKVYRIAFNPQLQNIKKDNNDQTSVTSSNVFLPVGGSQLSLTLTAPIVNIRYGQPIEGYPATEEFSYNNYTPGEYAKFNGTVNFTYDVTSRDVVERNNAGTELIELTQVNGSALVEMNNEITLTQWNKTQDVEQTIGMPFLSDIPYLGYLFSTKTTSKEKVKVILTVKATLLNTAVPNAAVTGELLQLK